MNLPSGFIQQCQHSPHAIAFTEGARHISYAQFHQNSQAVAACIQQRLNLININNTHEQHRIALLLERGIDAAAAQLPQVKLYNLYGPTETNVCCYWPVDCTRLQMDEPIPIGLPACHALLKINQETSELWVKSTNNFAGYWQQGKLRVPGTDDNWHATGDKVSLNHYGEYCYHGRLDRMLKCSGYRIEPAEIEHVINHLPAVANCAIVAIDDAISGQRPAAAVVLKANYTLADIVNPLKAKLPVYMHPCKFLVLEQLPVLSNGKIDFQAIKMLFRN